MFAPIYIDPQTSTDPNILVAEDSLFTQNLQLLSKASIINVSRVFLANAGLAYPYPTQTILFIQMDHGVDFKVELQRVANQATWNTGTAAAADVAVSDINASM